jgi:hypothetical protein
MTEKIVINNIIVKNILAKNIVIEAAGTKKSRELIF